MGTMCFPGVSAPLRRRRKRTTPATARTHNRRCWGLSPASRGRPGIIQARRSIPGHVLRNPSGRHTTAPPSPRVATRARARVYGLTCRTRHHRRDACRRRDASCRRVKHCHLNAARSTTTARGRGGGRSHRHGWPQGGPSRRPRAGVTTARHRRRGRAATCRRRASERAGPGSLTASTARLGADDG
jgi:hypothetical protein